MKKQTLLAWLGGTLALAGLGSANGLSGINVAAAGLPAARTESQTAPATNNYYYNFEDSLGPWKSATDSVESVAVTRGKGDDGCLDAGYYFANLLSTKPITTKPAVAEVPQPIGTWMLVQLPAAPATANQGLTKILVDWAASSRNKSCEGCVVAAYAGAAPPMRAGQFQQAGVLAPQGWKNYHASFEFAQGPEDNLYVAIGWLGIDASVGIDCVHITIGR